MTTKKILLLWIKKGIIWREPANVPQNPLYLTAQKFAKAICEMDGTEEEKWHFANEVVKIYPEGE